MAKNDHPRLTSKTLSALRELLQKGVPVRAAGAALGFLPATIAHWMELGSAGMPSDLKSMDGPTQEHRRSCILLADLVLRMDGKHVAKLAQTLWSNATRRSFPDMTVGKFLWDRYASVHGRGPVVGGEGSPATGPTVQVIVSDNGRGPR
jgi:hypothetical protein